LGAERMKVLFIRCSNCKEIHKDDDEVKIETFSTKLTQPEKYAGIYQRIKFVCGCGSKRFDIFCEINDCPCHIELKQEE
jgi:hypothetical protein